MVLPISITVHEIQCGSLVHFCMVNSGYKKSGHHSKLVLRLAHTVSFYYSVLLVALQECGFLDSLFVAGSFILPVLVGSCIFVQTPWSRYLFLLFCFVLLHSQTSTIHTVLDLSVPVV